MYGKTALAMYGLLASCYTHTGSKATLSLQIKTWILPGSGKDATHSIRSNAACLSDQLFV